MTQRSLFFDFENEEEIIKMIQKKTLISDRLLIFDDYELPKLTISLLFSMSSMENMTLSLFKDATQQILTKCISTLIAKLQKISIGSKRKLEKGRTFNEVDLIIIENEAKFLEKDKYFLPQLLSKWWVCYLSILAEICDNNKDEWTEKCEWWDSCDESHLKTTFEVLETYYYWKLMLLKNCCSNELLCSKTTNEFLLNPENFGLIIKNLIAKLDSELKEIELEKILQKNESKTKIRSETLQQIKAHLEEKNPQKEKLVKQAIITGRFDKTLFNLSHTVIYCEDGGFFALMNTITEDELKLFSNIDQEYISHCILNKTSSEIKLRVGQGGLGTIRFSLVLTTNEISNSGKCSMAPGQIICVKKTGNSYEKILKGKKASPQEIRENTWNDYSIGDIGKIIYSPEVYDFKIIEKSPFIAHKHIKGYTFQQLKPIYDGRKVFEKNGKYFNDWSHQKSYLVSIFDAISKLLNKGICMTDLKPANTLYDGENQRGVLIDLAGVVKKNSREALEKCKMKYIKEVTKRYLSPELMEAFDKVESDWDLTEKPFDLCKASSYSLGLFIEEIILKNLTPEQTKNETDRVGTLQNLVDKMKEKAIMERISIEMAHQILIEIDEVKKEETDFTPFILSLRKETLNDLEKFGLNKDLMFIQDKYIELKASNFDPEKYDNVFFYDLNQNIDDFFERKSVEKEQVFILLGSSGSGKSTLLQLKYLQGLLNWKKNDAIPLYMNLAIEMDIKERWSWICNAISLKENQKYYSFNNFTNTQKGYPVVLFLDSFDEAPYKRNFASDFLGELGNNERNLCMVCCRSEFIQNDTDLEKWFKVNNNEKSFKKMYIAPLLQAKFDYEAYIEKYFQNDKEINPEIIIKKIQEKNLHSLMKTSYMVLVTLNALPEMMKENQNIITRNRIYERYVINKIELTLCSSWKELIAKEFSLKDKKDFVLFSQEQACHIAKIMFQTSQTKMSSKNTLSSAFFKKFGYNHDVPFFKNQLLVAIKRILDLSVEIKGNIPSEQISLGFAHDTLKNFFIIKLILQEIREGNNETLKIKLFVSDETLIKFFAEIISEEPEYQDILRRIIYKTRSVTDEKSTIAAANAISILIAANLSFSSADLSNVRIKGANLRDGVFTGCDFSYSDLSGCNLSNCQLDDAFFNCTLMNDVEMGSTPVIKPKSEVFSGAFTRDGKYILTGDNSASIKMWDKNSNLLQIFGDFHNSMAISDDGSLLCCACENHELKLMDCKDFSCLKLFVYHTSQIECILISHDNSFILSCAADKKIIQLDIKSGSIIRSFEGHSAAVTLLCMPENSSKFISASLDKTVKVWSLVNGGLLSTISVQLPINCMKLHPNEAELITGCESDSTISLWDIETGSLIKSYGIQENAIYVDFSNDGKEVISISNNFIMKLWGRENSEILKTIELQCENLGNFISFYQKNELFLVNTEKKIMILDREEGEIIKSYDVEENSIIKQVIAPIGTNKIYVLEDKKKILVLDFETLKIIEIFDSHSKRINSVEVSHNNKLILSSSSDNSVKLWDLSNKKCLNSYNVHDGPVNSAIFSSDDEIIMSCSEDRLIKLFYKDSGEIIKTLKGHSGNVSHCIFSPNEQEILSGSHDCTLKIWNKTSGIVLKTIENENPVTFVAFSPNGQEIAASFMEKSHGNQNAADLHISIKKDLKNKDFTWLKVWEKETGDQIKILKGHSNSINSFGFSPDGTTIVTGSTDKFLKLWDNEKAELLKDFPISSDPVNHVRFSPDGMIIMSCSGFNVTLLSVSTGTLLKNFQGHKMIINCVAIAPNKMNFISGSDDETVKLWDFSGNFLKSFEGHNAPIYSVAYSPDSQNILSGSVDKTVKLWSISSGKIIFTFTGHLSIVNSVAFCCSQPLIISGSVDTTVKIWDITEKKLIESLEQHKGPVYSVDCSHNSQYICSGSYDRTIKLWDLETRKLYLSWQAHENYVRVVKFSPNDKFIASGSDDKTVKLWETNSGALIKAFLGHTRVIRVLKLTENHIFSGSGEGTINVWDYLNFDDKTNNHLIESLKGHTDFVNAIDISNDGLILISGAADYLIKIWKNYKKRNLIHQERNFPLDFDAKQKRLAYGCGNKIVLIGKINDLFNRKELNGHIQNILSLAFYSEDNLLASGSEDKTIKIWDLQNNALIKTLEGHLKSVIFVNFADNGQMLLSSSEDDTIKLWETTSGKIINNLFGVEESPAATAILSLDKKKVLSFHSITKERVLWDLEKNLIIKKTFGEEEEAQLKVWFDFKETHFLCSSIISNKPADISCIATIFLNAKDLSYSNRNIVKKNAFFIEDEELEKHQETKKKFKSAIQEVKEEEKESKIYISKTFF